MQVHTKKCKCIFCNAKRCYNDNVNENDNDNVNDNENEYVNVNDNDNGQLLRVAKKRENKRKNNFLFVLTSLIFTDRIEVEEKGSSPF